MKLLTLFAISGLAFGQTLTLTGPASSMAGATVPVTIALAGTSGQNITGIQWSIAPPTGVTLSSATISSAASGLGKGLYCSTNGQICLEVGLSPTNVITNTPWTDGQAATVQIALASTVPVGSLSIPLSGLVAVNTTGNAVALTSGATYSIRILSHCDLNGDGVVDYNDAVVAINAVLGKASCPSWLSSCTLGTVFGVLSAASGGTCPL